MSNLNEKISQVRSLYDRECAELNRKYSSLISEKRAAVAKIEATDYYLGYIESYTASLGTLEEIYKEIEIIQNRTLGIEFRVGKYLPSLTARPAGIGAIEYFSRLVYECREAIMMVRSSSTIEGDVLPLKKFCQGLVDLRYLVKNARDLLKISGDPDREKAEALKEAKAELKDALDEEKEAKKFENMECYSRCMALKEEIASNAIKLDSVRLGDAPKGEELDGEGYRFLIGFSEAKLPQKDRDFAEKTLGADPRGLTAYPVYFNYTGNRSTLIVRAKSDTLFGSRMLTFMRNLYFSIAGSVYSGGVRYFGAECNPTDNTVIGKIASKIKTTLTQKYLITGCDKPSSKNYTDMLHGFEALEDIWSERSDTYDDTTSDVFAFNRKNPEAKQSLVMANIWGYPDLFNADSSARAYSMLEKFAQGRGDEGFITVIGEKTDGNFTDKAPKLDADKFNADVIEIDSKGHFTYNGTPMDANIECSGFDAGKYWNNLKSYYETQVSTALADTIKQLEKDRARGIRKRIPFYEKFVIPMGANEDTSGFDVEISFNSNQCFGIILGGTRSGKSSFLHSFILSACTQYDPDEIQFYLADFKEGGDEAPEFSNYKNLPGLRNLCMPHVRYLLLKSSPENTIDLLNKIISLMRERNAFIKPYSSCYEYNRKQVEMHGKDAKKLPFVFFLIDEANNMLSGGLSGSSESNDARGDARMLNEIKTKIALILKLSASSGIGVIFAGQDTTGFSEAHIAQMGTRICLKVDNEQIFRDIFNIQYSETSKMISRLDKGRAYYTGQGMKMAPKFVRTAYAGPTTGEQALGFAERVREKYAGDPKYSELCEFQVLAGNEDFIGVEQARKTELASLSAQDEGQDEFTYVYHHDILMGLSSAAAIPAYLKYDTNTDSRSYYAVAPEQKLIPVERTAIFSFLETYKNSDGSCPDVSYYALPNIRRASMDGIMAKIPGLAGCLNVMRKQSDLAYKIMELGKLFNERMRMLKDDEADRFDPVFLVIHDPEFIYNKKNTDWLPDFSASGKEDPATKKVAEEDLEEDIFDLDEEMDEGDLMAMIGSVNVEAVEAHAPTKSKERDADIRFTATDVRETLTTLFNQGNRYSIYLLILATSEKTVDMVQSGTTSSHNFCIYSSLGDLRGKKDVKSGAGCAYIVPDGVKTRLLEYKTADLKRIIQRFQ